MSEAKKTEEAAIPVMVPLSSVWIPDDIPNRGPGWEKKLDELTASIKSTGQVVPISVAREDGPNGEPYKLLAGQRRIEAHKKLGRTTIKAVLASSKATKKDEFCMHVAENFGRAEHTPLEEAGLINYAVEKLGMTQQEFADRVGKTSGWVSQRLALLRESPEIQQALQENKISFTHMRDLARVKDPEEKAKLLKHAESESPSDFKERVDKKLGVAPTATTAKKGKAPKGGAEPAPRAEPVRPKKEVSQALKQLDKAFMDAKKASEKEKAAHLSGIIKGISWACRMKSAKLPVSTGND